MRCDCVLCAFRERRFQGRAWTGEAERFPRVPPRPAVRLRGVGTRIGRTLQAVTAAMAHHVTAVTTVTQHAMAAMVTVAHHAEVH